MLLFSNFDEGDFAKRCMVYQHSHSRYEVQDTDSCVTILAAQLRVAGCQAHPFAETSLEGSRSTISSHVYKAPLSQSTRPCSLLSPRWFAADHGRDVYLPVKRKCQAAIEVAVHGSPNVRSGMSFGLYPPIYRTLKFGNTVIGTSNHPRKSDPLLSCTGLQWLKLFTAFEISWTRDASRDYVPLSCTFTLSFMDKPKVQALLSPTSLNPSCSRSLNSLLH